MDNNIRILKNYILYFLVGLSICMVGITGVFADTVIDTSTWVDVSGRNWSLTGLEYSADKTFNNDVLLNNYNITGGIYTPPADFDYITFSFFEHNSSIFNPCNSNSKFTATFRLLFTTPSFVNYVDSVKWGNDNCSITNKSTSTGWIDVSCIASPSSNNYTDIFINYTTISGTNTSQLYITRNIDISCGLNTDAIINNDNANTQNIINNNNQNTQNIINNQNSNTDKEIESQKVCETLSLLYDKSNFNEGIPGYLRSTGEIISNDNWVHTDFITLDKDTTYTITVKSSWANPHYCIYNENKTLISCQQYSSGTITKTITGASYIKISYGKEDNVSVSLTGKTCKNGNQAIADDNKEAEKTRKGILGKIGELINRLFSNDDADVSGLDNMAGWLPPGPLDSIINLPLNLFNALVNTLSGTCSPVSLNLPFVNQILTLPCFDTYMTQYLTGFSTIWTFIGVTVSIFILYNYLLSLYKWVDDTLTLRENNLPGYYDDNWGGGA